jgi:hypothetical protein
MIVHHLFFSSTLLSSSEVSSTVGSFGAAIGLDGTNSPRASSNEVRPSSDGDLGDENHAPGKNRDDAVDSYRDLGDNVEDDGSTGCKELRTSLFKRMSDDITKIGTWVTYFSGKVSMEPSSLGNSRTFALSLSVRCSSSEREGISACDSLNSALTKTLTSSVMSVTPSP